MIEEITEKTREFLLACKEAGYERVTIFVHDKRVPCSVRLRKGSTGWDADEDGLFVICDCTNCHHVYHAKPDEIPTICSYCNCEEISVSDERVFHPKPNYPAAYWGTGNRGCTPLRVVCGAPKRLRPAPISVCPSRALPWMWQIVKDLDLNQRGGGHLDGHDIRPELCHLLTAGYYDLAKLSAPRTQDKGNNMKDMKCG